MSKPKPIKGKDEDFLRPRRSIILTEFFPRSFLEDHPKEILEVIACHTVSIVEVDNSNEIKQMTYVFDRIKPSTTRFSIFQRLSMAMKEEENQCPTSTSTRTSAFKKLSISTSKKDRPLTSLFDRLKMKNNQQREMKILKSKIFHEENNDDGKIHSRIPSRMKRKLSIDISTEGSLTMKPKLIIFINSTNEEGVTLPLLQNVDQRTLLLSNMLQTRIFPCVATERIIIFIFIFSQVLQREDLHLHLLKYDATEKVIISNVVQSRRSSSSSSFSHMHCSRKGLHLHLITSEKDVVSNMLQPRMSSFQICCNREGHRLKYVAVKNVVVSNMLKSRMSLSQICCSREGRRLKYIATEKIVVLKYVAVKKIVVLKYVAVKKIVVLNML
ncbi:Retrotransposon gag protein [Cucumis melo var. makuwa]|uniref:Retrotransposon gag protein n=1 Tax=Cucumis melo var. makuwa TaxID=1194695 RepID=A0A5D3DBL7_CUCMM|nr:Retrotransposon gag protein [Cucumis melo var. makuwa]TYK20860.1 Retrotransposon gag protein [Cucumis melo var. makuwa]